VQIEECFAAVKSEGSAAGRKKAQKQLALIFTGHSIAEESVIYPAMSANGGQAASDKLDAEQRTAKVNMAAVDELEPMGQAYLDPLEHIRTVVAHHMYEVESECLPKLKDTADTATQPKLSRKYKEESEREVHPEVWPSRPLRRVIVRAQGPTDGRVGLAR
jgi:hypothetical protein